MELANKNMSYIKRWQSTVTFAKKKMFLMQLKLQFLKRLSCYIEGRAHKPANV